MLKQSVLPPAQPQHAETRRFPGIVLASLSTAVKRESCLVRILHLILLRATNDVSRTTNEKVGLFKPPAESIGATGCADH